MTQKEPDASPRRDFWREALRATTLGWELALPIFGGVLAGYYLDRRLETGHIFTLGLLMLGLGASAYNLWRFIQRLDARQKQDAAKPEDEEQTG
jgi:predicted F0F1-ATPase subunit